MDYQSENRRYGKSFIQMMRLECELKDGARCMVVTLNPEKTKRDFKYITGSALNLEEGERDFYTATLKATHRVKECFFKRPVGCGL